MSCDLSKAIIRSRDDNPAIRSSEDFVSFWEYNDNCNETEWYGGCQACVPCSKVSSKHLLEMERALLKYAAEKHIDTKWAHMWAPVQDRFESILKGMWLENSSVGRSQFVRGHMLKLGLFMDQECMLRVETALDETQDANLIN